MRRLRLLPAQTRRRSCAKWRQIQRSGSSSSSSHRSKKYSSTWSAKTGCVTMHNAWVIIRRENLGPVRAKAFILSTFLIAAFFGAMFFGVAKLATVRGKGLRHIVLVTSSDSFAQAFKTDLSHDQLSGVGETYEITVEKNADDATRARLNNEVATRKIDGYLWAPPAALVERKISYRAQSTTDFVENTTLRTALRGALIKDTLAQRGFSPDDTKQLLLPVELDARAIEAGGEVGMSAGAKFGASMALGITLFIAVLMHGMAVMRSVLEEKTSRVFEVLLASTTAKQLMAGKIIGVGGVGLTQMAIWYALAAVGATPVAMQMKAAGFSISLPLVAVVLLPVFFILGYLLYSTIWAALGAAVNSEAEAQQLQTVVMLPLMAAYGLMFYVVRQPDAPLAVIGSLIPFWTPLLMYMRVVAHTPPAWQIALSIVLMIATIYVALLVCSRIYRVGILMYGKRPTVPELVRWFRYA